MCRKVVACSVIAAALLVGFSSAKADDTYNFSVRTGNVNSISAFGSFTSNSMGTITSVAGTVTAGSFTYNVGYSPFTNTFLAGGAGSASIFAVFATTGIATSSSTGGNITIYSYNFPSSQGAGNNNVFIGAYHQTNGIEDLTPGYGGAGFFEAVLASAGGTTGGGSSSGGAPSPEVNAFLGLAIAGSTVAFLRRKRAGLAVERS